MTNSTIEIGEVVKLIEVPENHYYYRDGYIFRTVPICNSDILISVQVYEITIGAIGELQKGEVIIEDKDIRGCVYLGDSDFVEIVCDKLKRARSIIDK